MSLPALGGLRILVVEDEWAIASELAGALADAGAVVIGPAGELEAATRLARRGGPIDGAVLDVNLRGGKVYPLADLLVEEGIPVILATGYERSALPARYKAVPVCPKPVSPGAVAQAILSAIAY